MEQKITILILTGGRRHCLEQCLSCIYETSDDSEREIIIWDNASEDDTQDFLGSLMDYPGIRAIRSEENVPAMPFIYMLKLLTLSTAKAGRFSYLTKPRKGSFTWVLPEPRS